MSARLFWRGWMAHVLIGMTVLTLATGCAEESMRSAAGTEARQAASAGYTGCSSGQNKISNLKWNSMFIQSWNVTCEGKVYRCTAIYQGPGPMPKSMSCAAAVR